MSVNGPSRELTRGETGDGDGVGLIRLFDTRTPCAPAHPPG